jgi:hypothetical protein
MTTDDDPTRLGTAVSITVWIAGATMHEAEQRRQAVDEYMTGPSVTYIGGGFGRFFYDLWCVERSYDGFWVTGLVRRRCLSTSE